MKKHIITIDGKPTDHSKPLVEMIVNNDNALGDPGDYAPGTMALNTSLKKLWMVTFDSQDKPFWAEVGK